MSRNLDVLSAMNDARESGDLDEYYRLLPDLQIPAASLITIKNTPGHGGSPHPPAAHEHQPGRRAIRPRLAGS